MLMYGGYDQMFDRYTILSFPIDVIINSCSACVEHAFTPPSAECTHTEDEDRTLTGT